MNQGKTIIRNIFSNWTGYLVSVVIGLILSPVVVHSLGNNLYGIWTIIVAFSGYYGLVNLGIAPAVSYYLSHHYARKEYDQINQVASTAFFALTLLSFVVLSISFVIALCGEQIFSIDPQHVSDFRLTVFIMALNFSLGFVFAIFQSFLVMLQRYDLRNANQILFDIIRTILLYIALKNGYKIVAISIITTACTFCMNIGYVIIVYRIFEELKIKFLYASRSTLHSIFNYGFWAVIGELGRQLLFYSSAFVIGAFLNTAAITFFAIAGNLFEYARNLLGAMTRVFFPVAAQQHSRSEFDKLRSLYFKGSRYTFILTVIIIVGFIVVGKQFIILWMGKEYTESYKILVILCIGYVPFFLSYTSQQILLGAKKIAFIAKLNAVVSIGYIVISILLIKEFGIVGVAWGTTIALTFQSIGVMIKCGEMLNVSNLTFFSQVVFGPILCSIPVAVLGLFFQHHWVAGSWPVFIIQTVILTIVYFMMVIYICLDKKLRRDIFNGLLEKLSI